jgi:hypothetical protein
VFTTMLVFLFMLASAAQTKDEKPKWEKVAPDKEDAFHSEGYRYNGCNVYVRRGNAGLDLNAVDLKYNNDGGLTHIVNLTYKDKKANWEEHWTFTKNGEQMTMPGIRPDIFGNKCGWVLHLLPKNVLELFGGLYGFPKK